jgi:hypothetical protein
MTFIYKFLIPQLQVLFWQQQILKKTQCSVRAVTQHTMHLISTVARDKKLQSTKINLYLSAAFPCIFIAIGPATIKMAP